ncbi:MAG: hypothetical protein IPI81_08900 [Flavobacteriales bacterium]|nr:hypothetical protein [Flavobacteriales bacterium]MCC6938984.1 hypothetical protein [Flavobacteriales bacterium]
MKELNRNIRNLYRHRLSHLRSLVNQRDPIGLIEGGAPIDEYDMEVGAVLVGLNRDLSEEAVLDLVSGVFEHFFGDDGIAGPKEAYRPLSTEIHQWLYSSSFQLGG